MTDESELREHLGAAVECAAIDNGPLGYLSGLVEVQARLDRMLHEAVATARADGATWAGIGEVLGTTRQAVQKRFGAAGSDSEGVSVPASRATEIEDLNELGQVGYRLAHVGFIRHEVVHVGGHIRHARALSIAGASRRYLEDGWTIAGWRFPDVFFWRIEGPGD